MGCNLFAILLRTCTASWLKSRQPNLRCNGQARSRRRLGRLGRPLWGVIMRQWLQVLSIFSAAH